jgi:hypothetical protein
MMRIHFQPLTAVRLPNVAIQRTRLRLAADWLLDGLVDQEAVAASEPVLLPDDAGSCTEPHHGSSTGPGDLAA